METSLTQIADDTYRICTFIPDVHLQFCQFLIRDEEPLLFHAGLRTLFPAIRDAVSQVLDPARLRWIGCSHFEADECGAINEWLAASEQAQPLSTLVAKMVNLDDFATRPAHAPQHLETFSIGRHRMRWLQTPQVPHAWDAGLLFDETTATLFSSDLGHHGGDPEPVTREDIVSRMHQSLVEYDAGPFAHYLPFTAHTREVIYALADLRPVRLATMHGSTFEGDASSALRDMAAMLEEVSRPRL